MRRIDSAGAQRWLPPDTDGTSVNGSAAELSPQSQEVAQGYDDGYAKGYQEGSDAAAAESRHQLSLLSQLCKSAANPFDGLDEQVEQELCQLSIMIARQVIRRELHADPDQLAGLIRESRKLLGNVEGQLRINVHPDDSALVRRMFADDTELSSVLVEDDPSIGRGGCTLTTTTSFIDASVETRIARLAVQLLGDERDMATTQRDGDENDAAADDGRFHMVLS